VIDWAIVGIAAALGLGTGVAIGYFWDDIVEWASDIVEDILDALNWATEKLIGAVVYFVRTAYGTYSKMVEAYIQRNGKTYCKTSEKEISASQVPSSIRGGTSGKWEVGSYRY